MSIVQDIRTAFSRRDNALIQLILLNVLVFAGLIVLRTILTVSSASGYYPPVLRQFELSSALPILLRHPWTLLTYAFTHEAITLMSQNETLTATFETTSLFSRNV